MGSLFGVKSPPPPPEPPKPVAAPPDPDQVGSRAAMKQAYAKKQRGRNQTVLSDTEDSLG